MKQLVKFDREAAAIGDLLARSRVSLIDAINMRIECGRRLARKKASLPHGRWLPWLQENHGALGFGVRQQNREGVPKLRRTTNFD
jgi:hypothetical protein